MPDTYRTAQAYPFCPGCSHGLVLDALNRALVRLQWDPAQVVLVTDIGCVGLSDAYFTTSAFHGLHGRSLTYATGLKLARPELHVIVLIGDGGCGIGGAHLLNAARRNIGLTTLVFNNFNFGMTGGEHSVTTPPARLTTTTPGGNLEQPLDIAQTVAVNGATYVWRGTAYDKDLEDRLAAALVHEGFALLDIWELCVAYFAASNRFSPKVLRETMAALGFSAGLLVETHRPEYAAALRQAGPAAQGQPVGRPRPLPLVAPANLNRRFSIILAGSAGGKVRTAGRYLGVAATMAGLWATQRDDYPVTVRSGHSVSEIVLAPTEIRYTGVERPDALFIFTSDGYQKVAPYLTTLDPEAWLFITPELAGVESAARRVVLDPKTLGRIPRDSEALGLVTLGLKRMGWLADEVLLAAAEALAPAYAAENRQVVAAALAAV